MKVKLMDLRCKSCKQKTFVIRVRPMANGRFHNGLYCDYCGKWITWITYNYTLEGDIKDEDKN